VIGIGFMVGDFESAVGTNELLVSGRKARAVL
jgi:hypothetical protein